MSEGPEYKSFIDGLYIFDPETKTAYPVSNLAEWVAHIEDGPTRQLFRTQVDEYTLVSTVFLGIDHNYWGGDPILFESMCFETVGFELDLPPWEQLDGRDQTMRRYHTYEEAERGHQEMVQFYQQQLEELDEEIESGYGDGSDELDPVGHRDPRASRDVDPGYRDHGSGCDRPGDPSSNL